MKINLLNYDKNELYNHILNDKGLLNMKDNKRFPLLIDELFRYREEQYRFMEMKLHIHSMFSNKMIHM